MSGRHLAPPPDDQPGPGSGSRPDLAGRAIWVLGGLLAVGLALVATTLFGDRGGNPADSTTTTSPALATTVTTAFATTAPTSTPASSTTQPPTTAAATSTTAFPTTTADPLEVLVLGDQSIGPLRMGAEPEGVIGQLTAWLGEPDEDTGWVDSFNQFGTCPGTETRLVRWVSLVSFFTNGATAWAPDNTRHFFHYTHSASAGGGEVLTFRTAKGIALGSSVSDLREAYGSELSVTDDPLFDTIWEVASEGPGLLWGSASNSSDDGLVTAINGGLGCGE
jgi:hypothetical protein